MSNKRNIIILFSLLLFIILSIVFYSSYFSKINYVGNTIIDVNGINEEEQNNISVSIKTPRGLRYNFNVNDMVSQFRFGKYRAFNNLFISIPDSSFNKIADVTINYNSKIYKYDINQFKNSWNIVDINNLTHTKVYEIPQNIKSTTKISYKLISCFYLISFLYSYQLMITLKYLLLSACLLITIILIYKWYKRNKMGYPKRQLNIKLSLIIAKIIFTLAFIFHLNYAISGFYYFSTGYLFIIATFISLYYIVWFFLKLFKVNNSAFINTRLLFISICVSFLVIEFAVQINGKYAINIERRSKIHYNSLFAHTEIGFYHVRGPLNTFYIDNVEYSYARTTNSLGLSDKEPSIIKLPNEYRIIGIGDSFTEGDGTDKDSTWLKELERNINKYNLKHKLSFINAGICGSDPYFEYLLLKNKLTKYNPNLVVAAFNCSDINDVIIKGGIERFKKDGTVYYNYKPLLSFIYNTTHVSRVIINFVYKLNYLLLTEEEYIIQKEKAYKLLYKSVEMFSDLSKKNKFKLIIVFHPSKEEIKYSDFRYFEKLISDINKNLPSVETLNLNEYYKTVEKIDSSNYKSYFWKLDGHHNAKGYAAFGRGVEYKIKELGIIDSLKSKELRVTKVSSELK